MSPKATKKPAKKSASKKKKGGSSLNAAIEKYSKSSGFSKEKLRKVAKRGMGAYYSSGSRPGQTPTSWAIGRVRSFATGKGGARKADADLIKGKKKAKKK
jgi:hypothetical protein|tara:strand:- start:9458 stop:9757 length:300 start_codon:yes stop_codon:yes gene_type:complete